MFKILGADGKEYGPITGDGLKEWIAQGRCVATTQLQKDGGAWMLLSSYPEFAALLPVMPPRMAAPAYSGPSKTSGMAIASLVLGILGFCTCGVTAVVGLILGIIAQSKISKSQGQLKGSGLAIGGICVSGVALVLVPINAGLFLPALAKARQRAMTIQCVNNMKQLALKPSGYMPMTTRASSRHQRPDRGRTSFKRKLTARKCLSALFAPPNAAATASIPT